MKKKILIEVIERLDKKIDRVVENQSNMNITLAKQSIILEEHVKRSNMLEEKMEPVEKHVDLVKGVLKIVGFIGIGVIAKILHGHYG